MSFAYDIEWAFDMLWLFLQIDGFEQDKKVVVIAATNRKQDLDPALIRYTGANCSLGVIEDWVHLKVFSNSWLTCVISRFDSIITFGLPDEQNRQEIIAQYAKHLAKSDVEELAKVTEE